MLQLSRPKLQQQNSRWFATKSIQEDRLDIPTLSTKTNEYCIEAHKNKCYLMPLRSIDVIDLLTFYYAPLFMMIYSIGMSN
jgi:hypothetical protein